MNSIYTIDFNVTPIMTKYKILMKKVQNWPLNEQKCHYLRVKVNSIALNTIYWYEFLCCLGVVPPRTNVQKSISHLIRISNSMNPGDGRLNSQDADEVYFLLTGRPRKFIPS